MSIDAMKLALEALEFLALETFVDLFSVIVPGSAVLLQ